MNDLFDQRLRVMRRERAARLGPVDFLHRRAFDDIVERLSMIRRRFGRTLVLGCLSPELAARIRRQFEDAVFIEPSPALAAQTGARTGSDVALSVEPGSIDLLLSFNTLAESSDPAETLLRMRFALAPGGLCLGAFVGADSLPALRQAMRAADTLTGRAAPHVHPRIDPASLTQMLTSAGFVEPVVDVDRLHVRYPALSRLVGDLRAMAATSFLTARAGALSRAGLDAASREFAAQAVEGKTPERIELVHFAAWCAEDNG